MVATANPAHILAELLLDLTLIVLYGVNCEPILLSLSPLGCAIEVGAIAQSVLNAQLFQQTEMLVHAILDYLDAMKWRSNI